MGDFANRCGCEKYPLLKTMNRIIRNYPSPDPGCDTANPLFYSGIDHHSSPFIDLRSSPYYSQQSTKGFDSLTPQVGLTPANTQILVPTNSQHFQQQPSFGLTSQMYQQPQSYQQPQTYQQPQMNLEPLNTVYHSGNWAYKSGNHGLTPVSMPAYQFWHDIWRRNQLPAQKEIVA